tara:strand:- start:2070 stop:3254 length:1185 start_codon:yes stop_codon:yes gene_type:complete
MKLRSQAFSIFSFLLLVLFFTSCGASSENSTTEIKSYTTQVVDSVMFDRLSRLKLLDYDPNTKELLISDEQTREVFIINEEGEVLLQFNPHVESPAYVGDYDFGWSFYGDDGLVCHGNYYFYQFDKKGNKLARIPYPVETQGLWILDYNPLMIDSYTNKGETEVLAFITEPAGQNYKSQAFQDSSHMMYRMNFETGESNHVMEKQSESVYRTLGKYADRGFSYVTKMKNDRFAQIYSIDSMLYIFDVVENSLVSTIPIPKAFQPEYETIEFGEKGEPERLRVNASLVSTGDYIMISSSGRIPDLVLKEIQGNGGYWFESEEYEAAIKKYMTTNNLLFSQERYLGEVKSGIGTTGYEKISTSEGYFWMRRTYNDERDYQTFLKVKIVEDTNPEKL